LGFDGLPAWTHDTPAKDEDYPRWLEEDPGDHRIDDQGRRVPTERHLFAALDPDSPFMVTMRRTIMPLLWSTYESNLGGCHSCAVDESFLHDRGWKIVKHFHGKAHDAWAWLAVATQQHDKFPVGTCAVGFRGTNPTSLNNVLSDVFCAAGSVKRTFGCNADSAQGNRCTGHPQDYVVSEQMHNHYLDAKLANGGIVSALKKHACRKGNTIAVGHSLGGAAASLFGLDNLAQEVYTIGALRTHKDSCQGAERVFTHFRFAAAKWSTVGFADSFVSGAFRDPAVATFTACQPDFDWHHCAAPKTSFELLLDEREATYYSPFSSYGDDKKCKAKCPTWDVSACESTWKDAGSAIVSAGILGCIAHSRKSVAMRRLEENDYRISLGGFDLHEVSNYACLMDLFVRAPFDFPGIAGPSVYDTLKAREWAYKAHSCGDWNEKYEQAFPPTDGSFVPVPPTPAPTLNNPASCRFCDDTTCDTCEQETCRHCGYCTEQCVKCDDCKHLVTVRNWTEEAVCSMTNTCGKCRGCVDYFRKETPTETPTEGPSGTKIFFP